jgi:hypothetical protein
MLRVLFIPALCYLLGGCSALNKVAVVDVQPQHCELLKELSFHRACDHDGQIVPEDFRDFKRLALKIGADTIQCCHVAEDEDVLLGRSPQTGEMCTGARRRTAVAYRCGRGAQ